MSDLGTTYIIRDIKKEDIPFIMATWLRGLYYGNAFFALMKKDSFMDVYKKYLEVLISKSAVKIACLKEDENEILGYSVLSPDFQGIHWVFVKKLLREQGVGKSLLPQYPSYFTHFTDLGLQLSKKFTDFSFEPFKI